MSVFYDLASLVLVPSGYKASKVYAQKPLTTDGQLSFSRASTATRRTASGTVETVASNVPRLNYEFGETCPKLLLEPQRSNVLLQSNTFSTTWTNISSTATSGQAGYDGTNDAWLLEKFTATGRILQTVSQSGLFTFSVYAKKGTLDGLRLLLNGTTDGDVYFDLNSGTIGNDVSSIDAQIQSIGGGWYRCSVAQNDSVITDVRIYPSDASSLSSSTGTIYIQDAQLEAGAYPTSVINTTTAAVTRLADACSKTGISSLIGQTSGTLFVDFNLLQLDGFSGIVELNATTIGVVNRFLIWETSSNQLQANFGTMASAISKSGITVGRHKAAITYGPSFFKFFVDGVKIGQVVPSTAPSGLSLLSFETAAGSVNFQKKEILQSLVFKTELTEAQAIELTTL